MFTITDTSTNGIYLNNQETPVGRNRTEILKNGDTVTLAGYVISVAVLVDGATLPSFRPAFEPPRLLPTISAWNEHGRSDSTLVTMSARPSSHDLAPRGEASECGSADGRRRTGVLVGPGARSCPSARPRVSG